MRLLLLLIVTTSTHLLGQVQDRWQQYAEYTMHIDMDVDNHQYAGTQELQYTNNSPDTLYNVFYHLYFNAFQPNSMMDVRSINIEDADKRVSDRISKLLPEETGWIKVKSLNQDKKPLQFETVGTILEVQLTEPILPGQTSTFEMEWDAQVPIQIRRSGRDSKEGVDYSMSQWYPKMSEYDYQGWHANPYIGREFHGIWGNFDVTIDIDKDYIVGATGHLQNEPKTKKGKKSWNFKAENVHDFAWGADTDYKHTTHVADDGTDMHFYFIPGPGTNEVWARLPEIMAKVFPYIEEHFGPYPYGKYSFIQGGDGGMEYPMATLITGERSLRSLVGVSVHELMHSWYQMMLGTNEALYAWMDEGFTSYASTRIMDWLTNEGHLPSTQDRINNIFAGTYQGYFNLAKSGKEEPLTTHADHFNTNFAYGVAAYVKGSVFLNQLEYIIGKQNFDQGMLDYYWKWRFKHPNDNDFIRVMEKRSGFELDWYREYWVQTTKTIDYSVEGLFDKDENTTTITLAKKGLMPMPIDLEVRMKNGNVKYYNIPLRIMRNAKSDDDGVKFEVLEDWPWTHPSYKLDVKIPKSEIEYIRIDPTRRMADLDYENNTLYSN